MKINEYVELVEDIKISAKEHLEQDWGNEIEIKSIEWIDLECLRIFFYDDRTKSRLKQVYCGIKDLLNEKKRKNENKKVCWNKIVKYIGKDNFEIDAMTVGHNTVDILYYVPEEDEQYEIYIPIDEALEDII